MNHFTILLLLLLSACAPKNHDSEPQPDPSPALSTLTIYYADDGCTSKDIDVELDGILIGEDIGDDWTTIVTTTGTHDTYITLTDSCNPTGIIYHYEFTILDDEPRDIELFF